MSSASPYDSPDASPSPAYVTPGTRRLTLKRISPLSFGKMLGIIYVFVGLIVSVAMLAISVLGLAVGGTDAIAGLAGGVVIAILVPLFYGVLGFIAGVILSSIYNLAASFIGGIELHFTE